METDRETSLVVAAAIVCDVAGRDRVDWRSALGDAVDARLRASLDAGVVRVVGPDCTLADLEAAAALGTPTADSVVSIAVDGDGRRAAILLLRRPEGAPGAAVTLAFGPGENPRAIALFDLGGDTTADRDAAADAIALAVAPGADELPKWAAGPLQDEAGPFADLSAVCALVTAIRDRVLPGTGRARDPRVRWPLNAAAAPRPWLGPAPRSAAVWRRSGGVDRVVRLQERDVSSLRPTTRPIEAWPRELLLFSGATREALAAALDACERQLETSWPELPRRFGPATPGPFRAAVLAANAEDLRARLTRLRTALSKSSAQLATPDGVFLGTAADRGKTAFVFPGQGAQYIGMLGDLCLQADGVQPWFERLQATYPSTEYCPPSMILSPPDAGLRDADVALMGRALHGISRGAMSVLVGSLAMHDAIARAGVRADVMAGYSNGENAALIASGTWRLRGLDELFGLLQVVREHDEDFSVERGACLAVSHAPAGAVAAEVEASNGALHVALENCPEQVVIFGPREPIGLAGTRLQARGAICTELAFDRGHHTPWYAPTVERMRRVYAQLDMGPGHVPLYSCLLADRFPADPDAIRSIAVGQWAQTVRFGSTIERMYADGVRTFVEVGPGTVLTGFIRSALKGKPHAALPTNLPGRPGIDQLLLVLGRLFVLGHDVTPEALCRPVETNVVKTSEPSTAAEATPSAVSPTAPSLLPTARALDLYTRHQALMAQFLESQRLASEWLTRALGVARPAATARQSLPLLGDFATGADGGVAGRRVLDARRDRFLAHHTIGPVDPEQGATHGVPVMPFAFSFEMACEAAVRAGRVDANAIAARAVRALRWICVDDEPTTVRLEGEIDAVSGGLRLRLIDESAEAGGAAFEALVGGEPPVSRAPLRAPEAAQPVIVPVEVFTRGLFHGPALRSLHHIVAVDSGGIDVQAVVPRHDDLFAGDEAPRLLTPVALVDAASHVIALWMAQQALGNAAFPFQLDGYQQLGAPPGPGETITIRAAVTANGAVARADLDLIDGAGRIRARFFGLHTRIFSFPPAYAAYVFGHDRDARLSIADGPGARRMPALPAELVDRGRSVWIRVLARLALHDAERADWRALPAPHRAAWLLRRVLAKEIAQDILAARRQPTAAAHLTTQDTDHGVAVRAGAGARVDVAIVEGPDGGVSGAQHEAVFAGD